MKLHCLIGLCSSILVFAAGPAAAVFGSNEVDIKAYPHHVSIEERTNLGNRFIASGAILSPKIIVTVASAVNSYWYHPTDLIVRVGSTQTGASGTVYEVADSGVYNSPKYTPRSGSYDVAVLRLKRNITWDLNVRSIKLPNSNQRPPSNSLSFVSSWGSYEGGIYATKLRHATLSFSCKCYPYKSNAGTNNQSPVYNDPAQMLCVSNPPARGTCKNDDGAPLVSNGVLFGLATLWGYGCDNPLNESLFVDLANWENRYFIEGFL